MNRPLIKVCGLTSQEDALFCEENGVDLLGFIFHPASPRFIDPAAVGRINTGRARRVGIFGPGSSSREVLEIMKTARLDLAQLHGGQDHNFCREIGPERVIKVFWPESYEKSGDFKAEMDLLAEAAAWFLFDAGKSGGGHGRAIAEELLGIKAPRPWFLAGGLRPENIKKYDGPAGFDFNSGVEASPGRKDHRLVKSAVSAVLSCYGKAKAPGADQERLK